MSSWMRGVAPGFVVAALMVGAGFAQAAGVEGVWRSQDGEGLVEIAPCAAAADQRCGKLVWMKKPLDDEGQPQRDVKNPDAALQRRPVCGVEILIGLKSDGNGGYNAGKIYDPEEGRTYTGAMKLDGDALKVTGSFETFIKPISDTETWTRVTDPFERCVGKK
jgi:uncharacterized protein (DUF2147 family)